MGEQKKFKRVYVEGEDGSYVDLRENQREDKHGNKYEGSGQLVRESRDEQVKVDAQDLRDRVRKAGLL